MCVLTAEQLQEMRPHPWAHSPSAVGQQLGELHLLEGFPPFVGLGHVQMEMALLDWIIRLLNWIIGLLDWIIKLLNWIIV